MSKVGALEKLDLSLSAMMSPDFVLLWRVKSRLVVASQVKSLDTLLNISLIYSSAEQSCDLDNYTLRQVNPV